MQAQDLTDALQRFKKHFGQPVAGRSIYEFHSDQVGSMIEASIKDNKIDPRLTGDNHDLVEQA
jgi:hypothetical protein